ncbi:MAG: cupin domain-containing protein [Bacteroidetes bacterium]|nr:cupin domain-containing protein [Bacteroidota bacterium]
MDKIVNPVIGEEIIFLTTSKQSGGEKTIMEVTIGPKGGNPLHYHKRFSETFNVLEGELSIQVGTDKKKLKVGENATAPMNTNHRFYNTSGKPVRFTVELNPASEGFENVLRIAFGLAQDGKAGPNGMPKSFVHNGILMNMGEGYFVGLFSVLEKVFRYFGNSDKARQIEKDLLAKYCK